MHLRAATLDDLLKSVFVALLKSKSRVVATKGSNVELTGVVLELSEPRARLSRTDVKGHAFSCLGELFWYLSGSDSSAHMEYYLPIYKKFAEPDGTIHGAYGPRIFGGRRSQYEVVRRLLSRKSSSRQAIIQIFDKKDIRRKYTDIPCTCSLQIIIRDDVLSMIVHMRSNDAYLGLPHDVFCFTMIQELLARDLNCKIGTYKHMVGSLHLYDRDLQKVSDFLSEGVQPTRAMPPMPKGGQWPTIVKIIEVEKKLRLDGASAVPMALEIARNTPGYWADIIRLLAIYRVAKIVNDRELDKTVSGSVAVEALRQIVFIRKEMVSKYYETYIRKRAKALQRLEPQMELAVLPISTSLEGPHNAPH